MSAQTSDRSVFAPVDIPTAPPPPRGVVAVAPPSRPVKASRHAPPPGYAFTTELDGFDGPAQARDALLEYAAGLVRLGLVPAWGVRMLRQQISRGRVAWFVMLDGPDEVPPASLQVELRRRVSGGGA